ncbi:hypothetical protein, partial [Actinoallomurus acaciae]
MTGSEVVGRPDAAGGLEVAVASGVAIAPGAATEPETVGRPDAAGGPVTATSGLFIGLEAAWGLEVAAVS